MRKDHRWFRNPILTAVALLGAVGTTYWAWRVSMIDREVAERAARLESASSNERIGALVELALLASVQHEHTPAAFPLVLQETNDPDPEVRAQALISLSDLAASLTHSGYDALARQVARTTLLDHMRDPHPAARHAAASSLARLGPVPAEAMQALVTFASDRSDPSLRSTAVERLSQMERHTPEALAVIRGALSDTSPYVRATAVSSLGPWVPTDPDVARAVLTRLVDPDFQVRSSARRLFVVGSLVPPPDTIPDLIALLTAPDTAQNNVAAILLPRMGAAEKAAPVLLATVQKGLQSGAGLGAYDSYLNALLKWQIHGPIADQTRALLCQSLLTHPEPGSRQMAAWCLGLYRRHGADGLPALREALNDPDNDVRETVKIAIQAIESDQKRYAIRSAS